MEPADVVLRFLESMGRRSEAEFYLALFRAEAKERFAAIVVDANVARHATEAVVLDLRFLAGLGLTPVVTLGLFEPTDAVEHGSRIRRKLEKGGVPARLVDTIDAADAAAACRAGVIPVLPVSAVASTADDRFTRLGGVLTALGTRKLIFLHRPGALRRRGELVPLVNLTTEYDAFAGSKELSRKQRAMLAQTRRLIFETVPHKLVVSITSPLDLLRELFTVKGAGTLLRRGAVIDVRAGFDGIDLTRLRALLASSFGRPPRDEFFTRAAPRIYLEEGYRGAAIVFDTPLGAYLSKFAVDREAQGEGMGRDLWERISADHPVIFWRARSDNPISAWYAKLCDGFARFPEWHVFWKGLRPEQIAPAIEHALAQPVDIPHGDE
jgi:bifunctional N-acetylglutamate synthase/kinase